MFASLDVNADVGEGFPFDRQLLELISSANIACGFHAGDETTMRRLCTWCCELGVAVGAQVSYRDREGFGRRRVDIGYEELHADLTQQVAGLADAAESAGTTVAYLKPHGALYNRVVTDEEQAAAVVEVAAQWSLPLLGLPASVSLVAAGRAGLRVGREFFADRGYRGDGTLVPRDDAGALVTGVEEVAARMSRLLEIGMVLAVNGVSVPMQVDTICVHGDSPGAVSIARAVVSALVAHGVPRRAVW